MAPRFHRRGGKWVRRSGKWLTGDCPCPCDDGGGGGEHECPSCPSGAPAQVKLTLSNFVRNPTAGSFCPPHDAETDDCDNCLDLAGEYILDLIGRIGGDSACYYRLAIDWACSPHCEDHGTPYFTDVTVALFRVSGTEVGAVFWLDSPDIVGSGIPFLNYTPSAESPALSCLGWSVSGHHEDGSFSGDLGSLGCHYSFDWNVVPLAV